MAWQDYVIASAQIGFVIALVPTIRSRSKPPKATSIATVVLLTVIMACFLTLHLYFSAATVLMTDAAWAVIAVQTVRSDKKH